MKQSKNRSYKPRQDDDDPEYNGEYDEEIEEIEPFKRIMTTDLDRSYTHYVIPHRLNDNGTMECACKEVTRLLATATR